ARSDRGSGLRPVTEGARTYARRCPGDSLAAPKKKAQCTMHWAPAPGAEMAVGSARGAVIGAAHTRVAERLGAALRVGRAQRMARGVDAAERGAAIAIPQALRRRRRRVGARAVHAALPERAVGRGRAGRVALPRHAHAALTAGRVAVADDDVARAAAGAAAVVADAV